VVTVSKSLQTADLPLIVLCRGDLDLENESMIDGCLVFLYVVSLQECVQQLHIVILGNLKLMCELLVLDVLLGQGLLILLVGCDSFNNNKFCIDQTRVSSRHIIQRGWGGHGHSGGYCRK
jgi:hypothetical protein